MTIQETIQLTRNETRSEKLTEYMDVHYGGKLDKNEYVQTVKIHETFQADTTCEECGIIDISLVELITDKGTQMTVDAEKIEKMLSS